MSSSRMYDLEEIADRLEIGELMHKYAWAVDQAQWELLENVFAIDAEADFSGVSEYVGDDGVCRGQAAIIEWLKMSLQKFPGLLHFMSNQIIERRGDSAKVTTYMHALHLPMGGIYHVVSTRTDRGWRIHRFRLESRSFKEPAARLLRGMGKDVSDAC